MVTTMDDARLNSHAHQRRGERDDCGDREIDLAGDDEQRHGERDQRFFGEVEGEIGERPGVQEVRRSQAVDDEDGDGHDDEQRLPGEDG
jgi:hypothetical protein